MEKMLVSPSPQIRDNISTSKVMTHVLIALCPALAMSAYVFGGRALMLTGFCMITALIWERLCNLIMKRPDSTKDVSALVTGMLLAFNLPVTMPYWQAAIGTFVAIVIVKQLFGGLGQNFANPAIVGRIVLMLAFTGNMTHWVVPFYDPDNIVTGATPLAAAHSAPCRLSRPFPWKSRRLSWRGVCGGFAHWRHIPYNDEDNLSTYTSCIYRHSFRVLISLRRGRHLSDTCRRRNARCILHGN